MFNQFEMYMLIQKDLTFGFPVYYLEQRHPQEIRIDYWSRCQQETGRQSTATTWLYGRFAPNWRPRTDGTAQRPWRSISTHITAKIAAIPRAHKSILLRTRNRRRTSKPTAKYPSVLFSSFWCSLNSAHRRHVVVVVRSPQITQSRQQYVVCVCVRSYVRA